MEAFIVHAIPFIIPAILVASFLVGHKVPTSGGGGQKPTPKEKAPKNPTGEEKQKTQAPSEDMGSL